ncbi:hypothetical protein TWF481_003989 [Arthrobotrys musiformis]|uniref:HNH nuclease domain-containing protein n=1 Tax=Arthrobotrys musiformis TaxID=47236 RepID=A0AAV9WK42_9PEZI
MQAPGQLCVWSAEVWGEGHAGVPSETVANVTHFHSTDVSLILRFFEDLTSAEDTLNTITIHAILKQHGTIRPFRVNPFKGTFKEKPPLWMPMVSPHETLPLNMAARKKILAAELAYPRLWAILEGGAYGYWDLRETHPSFRLSGECSMPGNPSADYGNHKERIYTDHSASIGVISHVGARNPLQICITRYDHAVKTNFPNSNLDFGLGRVLSHARNQFSLSPCVDQQGNRRLVMTEIGNGFTILEFNFSSIRELYWHKQGGMHQQAVSQFDKRIEKKLRELGRRSLDGEEMEELLDIFQAAFRDATEAAEQGSTTEVVVRDKQPVKKEKKKVSWSLFDRFRT